MKRAFRIGYHRYYDDRVFERHLAFIRQHREDIDEITLFVEFSHHGYWPVEQQAEHARLLTRRIRQYREAGIPSVGLNVLCTIGHLDECWDVLPQTEMQHIVGSDGTESLSCLCPSGEDFLRYIAARYRLYARTGADFIWWDDDMRITNHNTWDNCYCPRCLRLFGEEQGRTFDREGLLAALKTEPGLQAAWDTFRANLYRRLMGVIREAVHGEDPRIELGYMSGVYAENYYADWVGASGAVRARPGDGFYTDQCPTDVLVKAFDIGIQLVEYPDTVTDTQYEFEDFNYQTLAKSRCMQEMECALALSYGCRGVLFNDMMFDDKPRLMGMVHERSAQWQALTDRAGKRNLGVFCSDTALARRLHEIGVPLTPDPAGAVAALVLGDQWEKLGRDLSARLLSGGVLTDGDGVAVLTRMGLGHLCGGKVAAAFTNGMAERFAAHPLNGEYAGYYRDVFMNFRGPNTCYTLAPDADAEILSCQETVTHIPGDCSLYRIVRPDGGRIAVDGYFQPEALQSEAKRYQLLHLLDWLSGGCLPVMIEAPCKVAPLMRRDDAGGWLVMLANMSCDDTGALTVELRDVTGPVYAVNTDGTLSPVESAVTAHGISVSPASIAPWRYILLTNQA